MPCASHDPTENAASAQPLQAAPGQVSGARSVRHLHQYELAYRWHLSERTLERWRWEKKGPRYLKIGARVVYRLEDVEEYEASSANEPER